MSPLQLRLAQSAREGVEKQYHNVQSALKDAESQLRKLMKRQQAKEDVTWTPDEEEDEDDEDIQWLTPKENKTRLQATFDYTKQLSEQVYGRLQTVVKATTYLPHQLKGGASQALEYAQELFTTLKSVGRPLTVSGLSASGAGIEAQTEGQ